MTFADFQIHRDRLLATRPELLDASETNLYRALRHLHPGTEQAEASGTIHRCHLATEWAHTQGLPKEAARRAMITQGVRDGLGQIFAHTGKACRWWLPEDCYPVYHDLARAAGILPRTFPTLPAPSWPEETPAPGREMLLITNPMKPLGRWLDRRDVAMLSAWLAASPERRLLIDAVYSLEPALHPSTEALLATSQVWLLHSLTKGWLHPRLFGTVLIPENDFAEWAPVFRTTAPPQANLAKARFLMARHAGCPAKVTQALERAASHLLAELERLALSPLAAGAPAYFFVLQESWASLLERDVLGIPVSVFGSHREDLTVLSSLSFITQTNPS